MPSRHEGRESDTKRHLSRFDREPSPKRSRTGGRQEKDRLTSGGNVEKGDNKERDHKNRSNDTLPLENLSSQKVKTKAVSKDSERKQSVQNEGTKRTSEPTEVPRSRSYHQHARRGNAEQVGRSSSHRETKERGWGKDSKTTPNVRSETASHNRDLRDEKSQAKTDNEALQIDGNSVKKDDQQTNARKRPAFRENKVPVDAGNGNATETVKSDHLDQKNEKSQRREVRFGNSHYLNGRERHYLGNQASNRGEALRDEFSSRGWYAGGSGGYISPRGRDRFNGRQVYHPSGARPEKWKHDLFQEVNNDPIPKNEEDQIAKLEALLAS